MRKLNLETAEKTIVLLKNENNLLPLDKSKIKTIGIIGPNADSRKALVGNYEGTASRYYTISEGIQEYVGDDVRVLVSEGCHLYKNQMSNLSKGYDRDSEVKGVCEASDVVVLCLGLDASLEGEEGDTGNEYGSGDKPNLNLPGRQQEILEIAYASGKPVILVLLTGSAMAVKWADEHVPAIIQGWYPGAQGGKAIANIIFGEKNPEGKLPVTFYYSTDELPAFEDYSMKNRTYRYMQTDALYPFGYGLSYTDYEYTNVKSSADVVGKDGVDITATVKNAGSMEGRETVQVYVKVCREGTPNAQLKGICKVALKPGEEKQVQIHLPAEAFGLFDEEGKLQIAQGEVLVYVGGQAPDARSEKLTGRSVTKLSLQIAEAL